MSGGMPADVLQRLGLPEESPNGSGAKGKEKATQAELLLRCAVRSQLFHTPTADAYASILVFCHH